DPCASDAREGGFCDPGPACCSSGVREARHSNRITILLGCKQKKRSFCLEGRMMMFGPNTPTPSTTPWARVGAVVLVAGLALTVLVLAFTWSTKTAAPRNFPLAVAGPEQVTSTIAEQLEA